MKLHEIFFQSMQKLGEYNENPFINRPLTRDELSNHLIRFEERLTWEELNALFKNLSGKDMSRRSRQQQKKYFRPMRDFLSQRWERLKNFPQLHYTNTFNTELTQMCETLATELADARVFLHGSDNVPEDDRETYHRYELLMPGINFENAVTFMNLNIADLMDENDKLQLHHFFLDNDLRIVHVTECLKDARNDMLLKHTSALSPTGTQLALSPTDAIRVRYHSAIALAAWECIENINNYFATVNTVKGALTRLQKCLENAGIKGDLNASDEVAAQHVHHGIKDFYDYMTCLPIEIRQQIYKLKCSENLTGLMEFILKKLFVMAYYDDEINEKYITAGEFLEFHEYVMSVTRIRRYDTTTSIGDATRRREELDQINMSFSCVDQMSIKIKAIIALNDPVLSHNPESTSAIIQDDTEDTKNFLNDLDSAFNAYLAAALLAGSRRYSRLDALQPEIKVALRITDVTFAKKFARQLITTHGKPVKLFFKALTFIPYHHHREFIVDTLMVRVLQKLFSDIHSFAKYYKLLQMPNQQSKVNTIKMIYSQLGAKRCRRLIDSKVSLKTLSQTVSPELFWELIESWLTKQYVESLFKNKEELLAFVDTLAEDDKKKAYDLFALSVWQAQPSSSQSLFSLFKPAKRDREERENDPHKRVKVEAANDKTSDTDSESTVVDTLPASRRLF